jgi:ethanolamine utilization protein EutQ
MACFIVREQEAKKLKRSTATGSVSEKAFISQAIASPVSKNMTAGYIRLDAGYSKEFESPIDEIDLFLEGSLTYTCEGKSFTAQKGDIVFIEKGSRVQFVTEEGCFGFFVTYPLMQETIEALKKQKEKSG